MTTAVEMRKLHQGDNLYIIQELSKGVSNFWSFVTGVIPAQQFDNVKYDKNFSKRFHYAKWSEGEKQSFTLLQTNCIIINQLPWENPIL